MKNIYGAKTSGQIGIARQKYNGSIENEMSVLRALRWLKTKQNKDGSWNNCKPAMTGLALLCFLAHGETPGNSEEFGDTVQRGISYLIETQTDDGTFMGHDGNNYAHLIATYALCEAYGMMHVPMIQEAAEKAVKKIVYGQNPQGSWDYKMDPHSNRCDTSYSGWAAQALKAAKLAGIGETVFGVTNACQKAINGFIMNRRENPVIFSGWDESPIFPVFRCTA